MAEEWLTANTPGCSWCFQNTFEIKRLYAICPACERAMNPELYQKYLQTKERLKCD